MDHEGRFNDKNEREGEKDVQVRLEFYHFD